MSSLLIPDYPILILPGLAKMIGLPESVVAQQLHFLLRQKIGGKVIDGQKWIYNTYEQWRDDYFPFWSTRTIERAFTRLEEMHIVESCQPDGRKSRRKYYRLNVGMVQKLKEENLPEGPVSDDQEPDAAKLAGSARCRQIGGIESAKLAGSRAGASNNTETTTKDTGVSEEVDFEAMFGDPYPNFPAKLKTAAFHAAWQKWEKHRREKKQTLTPTSKASQLEDCAAWGEARAIAAINHSVKGGYTGLFEPNQSGKTNGQKPAPRGEEWRGKL